MNEIRDLIVGIDFGKEYSQICYYDRKGDEARSLSMKAGGNQYEAPCILCWRPEQKDYCVGLEADYFVREKGGVMIDDVYGICEKSDSVLVEGQELAPWEILAQFLQGMLKFLGVAELVKNTKCVAVTLPGLTEIQVENFQKAFEIIGFPHEKYMLLDYGESFYYYVLSQKRETWNRSVGWYAFTPENVSFRKMTMNGATKPVTVKLEELWRQNFLLRDRREIQNSAGCPENTWQRFVFQHSDHRRWIFPGLGRTVCKVTLLSEKKGFLWE